MAEERWSELVVEDAASFRVDRRAYGSPAIHDAERERIFDRCWLYAAHESELPERGDYVTRTVGGRPVIVVRGQDGVVRALLNTCTHRGARVCGQPRGNARTFSCPYHAWTFDTRGALRGLPGRDAYAPGFPLAELDLRTARVASFRELVFVTFDPGAPSLAEYLAGAAAELELVVDQGLDRGMEIVPGTQQYGVRANWKLLAENSIDSYHVTSLHRRYLEYLVQQGTMPARPRGRARDLGNGHAVSESAPPLSAKPVASWGPPMPPEKQPELAAARARLAAAYGEERARRIGETYRQLLIFPNLMVIDTVATTIRTWSPVGPDAIEVSAWALAPRGQPAEDRALAIQSFLTFFGPGGFATPDDIEVLEGCQRSLANREVRWADCSRGMARAEPSHDDDLPLRAFWRRWRDLMTDERAPAC